MLHTRPLQASPPFGIVNHLLWLADLPRTWIHSRYPKQPYPDTNASSSSEDVNLDASSVDEDVNFRHRHIAIVTTFPYHAEVYGPLALALDKVLGRSTDPHTVHIYDKETGFFSLMKRLGQLSDDALRRPEQSNFFEDIRSTTLFSEDPGAMIDLVYVATGERDLTQIGSDLLKAWDERPANRKFTLVCGVHNGADPFWTHDNLSEWSKRGALRLLPISDHVATFFRNRLDEWADSSEPSKRLSMYEYVKIDVFYPVSDFNDFPLPDRKRKCHDVPCTALLQGAFQKKRRDYDRIFGDLIRLLREDPSAWGYMWSEMEKQWVPDLRSPNPPFVLHLLGWSKEPLHVPKEIERLVVKHTDVNMEDFYTLVQSMDIMVPGFSTQGGYLTLQASSTMHTAVENHVPVLATRAMLEAYPYIRGVPSIVRPSALSEMETIGLLRGAKINFESPGFNLSSEGPLGEFRGDVQAMVDRGWKRTREEWDRHLKGIWRINERSVEKILQDV